MEVVWLLVKQQSHYYNGELIKYPILQFHCMYQI